MSEPTNLNEALAMLKHGNDEKPEESVEDTAEETGAAQPAGEPAEATGEGAVYESGANQVEEEGGLQSGDDDDTGGSADLFTEADLRSAQETLIKGAETLAVEEINRQFQEQGWQRFGINDIVERDEDTGRIRFRNPEDPNHDFNSRAEAQAWLDAYDKYFVSEWQNAVKQKQGEYLQEAMPALQMYQFAPTYQKMSKAEQDVFESLVEGAEVRDNTGQVIGYDLDLNKVANQARSISARFAPAKAKAVAEKVAPASGPAVDMPSAGSSTAPEKKEPKNLNDAMKMMKKGK